MVTQLSIAISSALAMVRASSEHAFSLRFFGISVLLCITKDGDKVKLPLDVPREFQLF